MWLDFVLDLLFRGRWTQRSRSGSPGEGKSGSDAMSEILLEGMPFDTYLQKH